MHGEYVNCLTCGRRFEAFVAEPPAHCPDCARVYLPVHPYWERIETDPKPIRQEDRDARR